MQLVSLYRYPVKSCRGEALTQATVEPWGLAGDRRWMVTDADGSFRTARKFPRLVLVRPQIRGVRAEGLVLEAPDRDPLVVEAPGSTERKVEVWGSIVPASDAGDEAAEWFSDYLGVPCRLVHLDDPTARSTDPDFSEPDDRVSFADGYPLLLTTPASLAALNEAGEMDLPMTRFRPSVVVSAPESWVEDEWRRIRVGEATFRAVKGCGRCVLTTVDPETAEKGKEPLRTLARIRRRDGQVWFGVNLIPDTPGATIRPGDPVEVLD